MSTTGSKGDHCQKQRQTNPSACKPGAWVGGGNGFFPREEAHARHWSNITTKVQGVGGDGWMDGHTDGWMMGEQMTGKLHDLADMLVQCRGLTEDGVYSKQRNSWVSWGVQQRKTQSAVWVFTIFSSRKQVVKNYQRKWSLVSVLCLYRLFSTESFFHFSCALITEMHWYYW